MGLQAAMQMTIIRIGEKNISYKLAFVTHKFLCLVSLIILHDATLTTELDHEGLNGVVAFTVTDRLKYWLFYDRLSVNFFSVTVNKKVRLISLVSKSYILMNLHFLYPQVKAK